MQPHGRNCFVLSIATCPIIFTSSGWDYSVIPITQWHEVPAGIPWPCAQAAQISASMLRPCAAGGRTKGECVRENLLLYPCESSSCWIDNRVRRLAVRRFYCARLSFVESRCAGVLAPVLEALFRRPTTRRGKHQTPAALTRIIMSRLPSAATDW